MTAYRPKKGTCEIDRVIPPLGRVRLRTGTHDKRRAQQYDDMLNLVPLDVVRLIASRQLTLREVFDLWSQGRALPSADELRPLAATLDAWLEHPLRPVGASEQRAREDLGNLIRQDRATLRELPALCRELYRTYDAAHHGATWNRRRAAALAFVRDVVGRRTELYRQVAEIPTLPEIARFARRPCTVAEARAIATALGAKWGPIWWALCCTGMGPKEFWSDGWRPLARGIEIGGQKRRARNRVVPLVVRPPAPVGTRAGFAEALERSALGVTPYDARRSFARWLDEVGFPGYRQDAYLGHGPKSMRELYKWGDITAWLAEDGPTLQRYVGEAALAVEHA
jgi:hypothetical protein